MRRLLEGPVARAFPDPGACPETHRITALSRTKRNKLVARAFPDPGACPEAHRITALSRNKRNKPQQAATSRNEPQWAAMGRNAPQQNATGRNKPQQGRAGPSRRPLMRLVLLPRLVAAVLRRRNTGRCGVLRRCCGVLVAVAACCGGVAATAHPRTLKRPGKRTYPPTHPLTRTRTLLPSHWSEGGTVREG